MEEVLQDIKLEPEETFIYRCLKLNLTRDDEDTLLECIRMGLQWQFISRIALENHVFPFIYRALKRFDEPDYIPKWIYNMGKRELMITAQKNELFTRLVRPIFEELQQSGVPYILLRGLMFQDLLYGGNRGLRAFSDIDLLMLRKDLKKVKNLLQSWKYRSIDGAFRDSYYEKHHLHLAYVQPERNITFEVHWALDHDYTNYHIDMESIFREVSPETVIGIEMPAMKPDDLLITTVVHAFKHYPMMKYFYHYPVLRRSVYQDGHLVRLLDICLILESMREDLDPESILRKAERWEVAQPFSATMHAIKTIFDPDGIDPYLRADALPRVGRIENRVKDFIFSPRPQEKREASRAKKIFFLKFLKYREDLYFNPLRMLDLFEYFFPPRPYFIRRHGKRTFPVIFLRRCQRCLSASAKVAHNLANLAIYSCIRAVEGKNKKKVAKEAKV